MCIREGKLYQDNIHKCLATVPLQFERLDSRLVVGQEKGRLPVIGANGAKNRVILLVEKPTQDRLSQDSFTDGSKVLHQRRNCWVDGFRALECEYTRLLSDLD